MAKKPKVDKTETPEKGTVICYFDRRHAIEGPCSGIVDYCYGCKESICDGHSRNENLVGPHEPFDHLEGDEAA
jgi:hypothetical protein